VVGTVLLCQGMIPLCPHPSPHPPRALLPELAAQPDPLPNPAANEGWRKRLAFPHTREQSWP